MMERAPSRAVSPWQHHVYPPGTYPNRSDAVAPPIPQSFGIESFIEGREKLPTMGQHRVEGKIQDNMNNRHSSGTAHTQARESKAVRASTTDALSAVRLCSVREAARYLALSEWTVRQLVHSDKLPCVRCGRRILIDTQDLDAWIAANKTQSHFSFGA